MAGKRQMAACRFRPSDLPLLHRFLVAGPQSIDDFALRSVRRFDAQRLAVFTNDRDFLRPEPLFGQRAQRCHDMDMRITVLVVINPIDDHSS
ncbi:hypothetical protein D3C72_1524390 [compost metagenome]